MLLMFPDYLFVSYDYGARNLDEYFLFHSIALLANSSKRRKYF